MQGLILAPGPYLRTTFDDGLALSTAMSGVAKLNSSSIPLYLVGKIMGQEA